MKSRKGSVQGGTTMVKEVVVNDAVKIGGNRPLS